VPRASWAGLPCWVALVGWADALHDRGEAITVAVTTAPTSGKICEWVASSYRQRHIHNRIEAPR
jgi:hypothetical protein